MQRVQAKGTNGMIDVELMKTCNSCSAPIKQLVNENITKTYRLKCPTCDYLNSIKFIERTTFVLDKSSWDYFHKALTAPAKDRPALKRLLIEPGVFDNE